jgi:signal transduction histidine kinase
MDLRHAQKLEAVGGLAAGIAHEINTPIQFVGDNTHFLQGAFADLAKVLAKYRELQQAAANGGAGRELALAVTEAEKSANLDFLMQEIPSALAQSLDGVTRVATIVKAMREFAHTDRGEKIAADLNKNLQSTLIVARNEIKYVADVETDFQELPLVKCNGGDMNQVFLNLLVNAAHAIKDRGATDDRKGVIGVRTRREADHVVISISDTGCGIPANIRDKIFEPFFTTKEVGRGTGQGLAIARTIVVERHGGSITFDTEVGRGTTFHIRLPIRPQ